MQSRPGAPETQPRPAPPPPPLDVDSHVCALRTVGVGADQWGSGRRILPQSPQPPPQPPDDEAERAVRAQLRSRARVEAARAVAVASAEFHVTDIAEISDRVDALGGSWVGHVTKGDSVHLTWQQDRCDVACAETSAVAPVLPLPYYLQLLLLTTITTATTLNTESCDYWDRYY